MESRCSTKMHPLLSFTIEAVTREKLEKTKHRGE
jgi:hypothetical protein